MPFTLCPTDLQSMESPGFFIPAIKKNCIIKKKVHVPVAGKKFIYDSS